MKSPFKTNNAFNFTMMTSFLPVIVSKKNKQTEKNMPFIAWLFIMYGNSITASSTECQDHIDWNYNTAEWIATPFKINLMYLTCRRGTCLALRFQTGSWMLFIDSRNSKKMAVVYTVYNSSIRIFNCLYFPDSTLKLHNCFAYFNKKINPWRMVFYFFILLLRLLNY